MNRKYSNLTPKQRECYRILKDYFNEYSKSPTLEELQDRLNLNHKRSVVQFLNALEEKGYIKRFPNTSRGIQLLNQTEDLPTMFSVPVVGSAGCDNISVFADPVYDESIFVDKSFITKKDSELIAIKAIGNSMQSSGISDGDHVLIEKTQDVDSKDRVAVILGDMAVIKRIVFNIDSVILYPDSPDDQYRPIVLKEQPEIIGKVLSVIPTQFDDIEYFNDEIISN